MVPFGACPFAFALLLAGDVAADPPPRTFTLAELLHVASEKAPALRGGSARLRAAGGIVDAARPWFPENPALTVGAGPRASSTLGADVSISLTQTFELAGERGLRLTAATKQQDVLGAELVALRWQVHVDVHGRFLRALVLRARVATEQDQEREASEILAVLEKRAAAGDASPLDVNVVRADAVAARQARARAEQALRAELANLAAAAGVDASVDVDGDAMAGTLAPADVVVAQALETQPALLLRTREAEHAQARLHLADAEAWPKPTLGVSYTVENLGNETDQIAIASIGVPLPFWQSNQHERAEAAVDVAGADADVEATRASVSRRARTARQAADAAAALVRSSRDETVPVVEASVALLKRAFELGEIDAVDLSNARQRLLSARREQLEAEGAWVDAFAALEDVAGVEPLLSPSSSSSPSSSGGSP